MKNSILFYSFLLLSFSISASIPYRTQDTIPSVKSKNIEPSGVSELKDSNASKEMEVMAEKALIRAEEQIRKARNAFIFSIITFGLFYVVALYWEITVLYNATIARRFYRKYSKNSIKREAANKVYYKAIGLLFVHIVTLFVLLLLVSGDALLVIPAFFSTPRGLAFFSILSAGVADYFFFHIFFEEKKNTKKR